MFHCDAAISVDGFNEGTSQKPRRSVRALRYPHATLFLKKLNAKIVAEPPNDSDGSPLAEINYEQIKLVRYHIIVD